MHSTRAAIFGGKPQRSIVFLSILFILGLALSPAVAQSVTWPTIELQVYTSDLSLPTSITFADDNSGNLYVTEALGTIRIIRDGILQGDFLDISDRVLVGGERGLLGLAFPPDYASKGYFYVYYTRSDGDIVVSRFHTFQGQNIGDKNSEENILVIEHSQFNNHNGGQLAFGPDGYLYIATGDGGGGGDTLGNGQNLGALLGKILRIDVESTASANQFSRITPQQGGGFFVYLPVVSMTTSPQQAPAAYTIPPDNPFINTPGVAPEIWSYGLRNPWRFSFDRQTGNLFIADVGQGAYEEVNFQPAGSSGGENYGWPIMEGPVCYNTSGCDETGILPVTSYSHASQPEACSVTGGYVYRGSEYASLQGFYLFGDFCSGQIWGLINDGSWQTQQLLDTTILISSFGEDQLGTIYAADYGAGTIYKIAVP